LVLIGDLKMTDKEKRIEKARETLARKIAERKLMPNAIMVLRGNFAGHIPKSYGVNKIK